MSSDGKLRERLLSILNRKRFEEDDCNCERCAEEKKTPIECETCGFVGTPVVMACQCYDRHCKGGTGAGTGCPHGTAVCPVCEDGDGWAVVREIRAALSGDGADAGAVESSAT